MRIQGGEYEPEPHEAPASVLPAFQVGPRRRSVFNVLHHLPDARLQLIRPLDGWRVQADSLIAVTFRDRICASDRSLLFNVRLLLLLSALRGVRWSVHPLTKALPGSSTRMNTEITYATQYLSSRTTASLYA